MPLGQEKADVKGRVVARRALEKKSRKPTVERGGAGREQERKNGKEMPRRKNGRMSRLHRWHAG